jgi:hypothetical protein
VHMMQGLAIDKVLHECVFSKTLDNITSVLITFENFERILSDSLTLQHVRMRHN